MKAMILAAGLGTRLKPWTDKHPKALALVNGKSLLQRNVEYLQQFGIKDVIINVHHYAGQIVEAIKNNNGWGSSITISDETNEVLETGGGLLKAKDFFAGEQNFLLLNSDVLTDLDLNAFLQFHIQQRAIATLATRERNTSRYFLFDKQNILCGWRNKTTGAEIIKRSSPHYYEKAFSGIHALSTDIFNNIKRSGKFSMVDVYLDIAAARNILSFDHSQGKFVDVGKPESIGVAETTFL